MRIIVNEKNVKKYRKIGSYFIWATFGLLIAGMALTFNQELVTTYITYYFAALFLALICSQIGMYITNRYGGNPRQDELINAALKGIDDRHSIYHFNAGVSHLLVGPSGIHVVLPYFQKGTITYDEAKGQWKQTGQNSFMKFFTQNSLGRPDLDVKDYISDATKFLTKKTGAELPLKINAILVFTNEKADVQATNAPVPTMAIAKLKDFIRRKTKEVNLSSEIIDPILGVLPEAENN